MIGRKRVALWVAVGVLIATALWVGEARWNGQVCYWFYLMKYGVRETAVVQKTTYREYHVDRTSEFYRTLVPVEYAGYRFALPPSLKLAKKPLKGRGAIFRDEAGNVVALVIPKSQIMFERLRPLYWASKENLTCRNAELLALKSVMVPRVGTTKTLTEFRIGDLRGFMIVGDTTAGERVLYEIFQDGYSIASLMFESKPKPSDKTLTDQERAAIVSTLRAPAGDSHLRDTPSEMKNWKESLLRG